MKKINYNSDFNKDIYNINNKFNVLKELIKSLIIVFGICLSTLIFGIKLFIPLSISIITVSIPIIKTNIKNKIKKYNKNYEKSLRNILYLVNELNIDSNLIVNCKSVTTKVKSITLENNNIIKDNILTYTDYYLKDIQNELKILRYIKNTIIKENNIINNSSLYLMEEGSNEYKRILK